MSVSLYGSGNTILQVQQTVLTTQVSTSSNSFIALTGLSVSITPLSTNSKILVMLSISAGTGGTNYDAQFQLAKNGSVLSGAIGTSSTTVNATMTTVGVGQHVQQPSINYIDSPSTTSSVTYSVLWRSQSGTTAYVNGGSNMSGTSDTTGACNISSITVLEISGS